MEKFNYIHGINPVIECIKANVHKIKIIYLLNKNNKKLLKLILENQIKYILKTKEELAQIKKGNQGVIAIIDAFKIYSLNELLKIESKLKRKFFVILDQIEDPHNFGAILRNCDLLNITGIIILNLRQVQLNATVAKVSAGAFNYVPVCVVNNLFNTIKKLKEESFWIYATTFSKNAEKFTNLEYNTNICLVLGNEAKGVSKKIIKTSDFNIYIPTFGNVDSFNVACASAILFYGISSLIK